MIHIVFEDEAVGVGVCVGIGVGVGVGVSRNFARLNTALVDECRIVLYVGCLTCASLNS